MTDTTASQGRHDLTAQLAILRHGQSTWNADGRWQGQADPPLSIHGRQQTILAAERLDASQVKHVVCSPLSRARETAQILSERIGSGPPEQFDGLIERDAGSWQGLTRDEIELKFPGFLGDGRRPPGWESDDEVVDRVTRALMEIRSRYALATTLCIAHGGIVLALEHTAGLPRRDISALAGRRFGLTGSAKAPVTIGPTVDLLTG